MCALCQWTESSGNTTNFVYNEVIMWNRSKSQSLDCVEIVGLIFHLGKYRLDLFLSLNVKMQTDQKLKTFKIIQI